MTGRKQKTIVISVRVPIEQREAIEKAAVAAGTSLSAFVARTMDQTMSGRTSASMPAAGAAKPLPRAAGVSLSDPAALAELKRIGININQIAHAINAGLPQNTLQIVAAFKQLFAVLSEPDAFQARLPGLREQLVPVTITDAGQAVRVPMVVPPAAVLRTARPLPIPPQPSNHLEPPKVKPSGVPALGHEMQAAAPIRKVPHRLNGSGLIRRAERTASPTRAPVVNDIEDRERDPPHSSSRHQLQDGRRLHPPRSGESDKRPRGLGLLDKLWPR